ncbi:MAG TPA: 4-hydroxyphenylpyruvate dioxygenase [Fibrobacteria bacterium]|nr:4-hydroxyphenylpyruvate dioxygenase [Fibrobacteria bacterium]
MKIKRIHHIEFYVGNAKQADYFYRQAFGFERLAYAGLETGVRDRASYALRQGKATFVLTSPYAPEREADWTPAGDIGEHIKRHGDGVRDIVLEVDDAAGAFALAVSRGAEPAAEPRGFKDGNGTVIRSAVKVYGDTIHSFLSLGDYKGPFLPGYAASAAEGRDAGLLNIDHYVANVTLGEMKKWEEWYVRVLGLERFMTFDDADIGTEFTALNSVVMANPSRSLKFPINEPAPGRRKSQVEEYNDFYRGPGVQHIALLTADIVRTVSRLRANGVEFLKVPDSYYEALPGRVGDIREAVGTLKDLGILADRDDQGYLLQIFTRPLEDRPTLFFEIIQRKGCQGFGKGNFKALFEAIEREQERRGNLV